LAEKVAIYDWTPSGGGSGQDLVSAIANVWQFVKDSGGVPADSNMDMKIENVVYIRFLP